MKNLKDVREGVWILAIIAFVFAGSFFMLSIQAFSLSDVFRVADTTLPLADPNTGEVAGSISPGFFFQAGLITIVLSLFSYFLGRGLLKGLKWTRYTVGVIASLLLVFAVSLMINGYFAVSTLLVIISGLEIWYIFMNKSTKKFFK